MKCEAFQEIRWEDAGTTKTSQTTIFNEASENAHKLGTGFAIHEPIKHTINEYRNISPRISTLKTDNFDMVLTNAHTPTEEKEEKESFYVALEVVFDQSKGNVKLVLEDFNAKFGQEEQYKIIVGKHSLHENINTMVLN